MGGIFLIHDEMDDLIELTEQQYDSEAILQALLAKYPNLLAGDQMDDVSPRRWLLVAREASLPTEEDGSGRWAIDHLFLDQDGIPTLVEVKRSSDTRIRREVIGQMLDYAANAVSYWTVDTIKSRFETRCGNDGLDADQLLRTHTDNQIEPDEFWQSVKTNLNAGRVRMVFVSDEIPAELQRVVEFLNNQMNPAEVLAVQIKQFTGTGVKTLVPRVMGLTASASDRKKPGRTGTYYNVKTALDKAEAPLQTSYAALEDHILSLGKDIKKSATKVYFAFESKGKAFARVIVQKKTIFTYLKIDPVSVEIVDGDDFIRDVTNIGHLGGKNLRLELAIDSAEDMERAKPYLLRAYQEN